MSTSTSSSNFIVSANAASNTNTSITNATATQQVTNAASATSPTGINTILSSLTTGAITPPPSQTATQNKSDIDWSSAFGELNPQQTNNTFDPFGNDNKSNNSDPFKAFDNDPFANNSTNNITTATTPTNNNHNNSVDNGFGADPWPNFGNFLI